MWPATDPVPTLQLQQPSSAWPHGAAPSLAAECQTPGAPRAPGWPRGPSDCKAAAWVPPLGLLLVFLLPSRWNLCASQLASLRAAGRPSLQDVVLGTQGRDRNRKRGSPPALGDSPWGLGVGVPELLTPTSMQRSRTPRVAGTRAPGLAGLLPPLPATAQKGGDSVALHKRCEPTNACCHSQLRTDTRHR